MSSRRVARSRSLGQKLEPRAPDYGYVLHLVAPGGEDMVVPNFRCLQLAVGDYFPYGGQDWVVTDIHLRLTDTTSFEVWAKQADAE